MKRAKSMKKSMTFATYLAAQIEASEKTQREIAEALGYSKPNLITMFKQGRTKVPIEKVPALANVLGLDAVHLLTLAMREYIPEVLKTINDNMGQIVSSNEFEIIEVVRTATKNANPRPTKEQLSNVRAVFLH